MYSSLITSLYFWLVLASCIEDLVTGCFHLLFGHSLYISVLFDLRLKWNLAAYTCDFLLARIRQAVVSYRRGRRWHRVRNVRRNLRIRVKGCYRHVVKVGKVLRVVYKRRTRAIRFLYGKLRFFYNKRWRRPSTRRARLAKRRRKRRRLIRFWRRFRRRKQRRRRKYGLRNGRIVFKYGGKFRRVRRKGGRLTFRVGIKYYGLR